MKFRIVFEIDVPEDGDDLLGPEGTAESWAGSVLDSVRPPCSACSGRGTRRTTESFFRGSDGSGQLVTCPSCGGTGRSDTHPYKPKVVSVSPADRPAPPVSGSGGRNGEE